MTDSSIFAYTDHLDGAAGAVQVAFTDRRHDLGDRAPERERSAALRAIADASGAEPLIMHQVHGADVQVVEEWRSATWNPRVDALITAQRGRALLTRAADCVPVLIADADAGLIAAVHAGRAGVAAGVVPETVVALRGRGAGRLTAWIGPSVCGACYEVPEAMREAVATAVPEASAETSWGTPSLDLGAGVRAQLAATDCEVRTVGGCTREDPRWHSHRRDRELAGRQAGVVWRT